MLQEATHGLLHLKSQHSEGWWQRMPQIQPGLLSVFQASLGYHDAMSEKRKNEGKKKK